MDDQSHVFLGFASRDWSGNDLVTGSSSLGMPAFAQHSFGSPASGASSAYGHGGSGLGPMHHEGANHYFGSGESFVASVRPEFQVFRQAELYLIAAAATYIALAKTSLSVLCSHSGGRAATTSSCWGAPSASPLAAVAPSRCGWTARWTAAARGPAPRTATRGRWRTRSCSRWCGWRCGASPCPAAAAAVAAQPRAARRSR